MLTLRSLSVVGYAASKVALFYTERSRQLDQIMSLFDFIKVIGCLALLMFGMRTMSEGLQKFAGGSLRKVLGTMTNNRFAGVATGAFITAAIQSSTATTLMTVSFVNAGLLTLLQAISVIMGANIGTTFTAWLMSLTGTSVDLSAMSWVIFACSIPFVFSGKSGRKSFGEFLFGFAFMFLGITTLRMHATGMHLDQNPAVMNFFVATGNWGFLSILLYVLIGGLLTLCVQSSAAIMAITMILCSTGVLPIYQGIALVMGENIGTTLTSNIAALSANTQARRAALAHLIFNLFGVVWVLIIFKPFVRTICNLWGVDADGVGTDLSPEETSIVLNKLNFVLATFHTAFNLINTMVLIWFTPQLEKIVCRIIPQKEEDEDFRLRYIPNGMMSTSELSLLEAQKEINLYAVRTKKMFGFVETLLHLKNEDEFTKLFSRIEKYESISDRMEVEIANYLSKVSEGRLSAEGKMKLQAMLREISELESICDSNYNLARTLNRKFKDKEDFTESQYAHIEHMYGLVNDHLEMMINYLKDGNKGCDPNRILNQENEINNYRSNLRNKNVQDVNDHLYAYQTGVYYIDLVGDFEKIGDYIINVYEARSGQKVPS